LANTSSTKGNPAGKRMSNSALKERRARSWKAGEKRKEERKAEAINRAKANKRTRSMGEKTPWELAKAARHARRHPVKG
jgi:hypothetical protein